MVRLLLRRDARRKVGREPHHRNGAQVSAPPYHRQPAGRCGRLSGQHTFGQPHAVFGRLHVPRGAGAVRVPAQRAGRTRAVGILHDAQQPLGLLRHRLCVQVRARSGARSERLREQKRQLPAQRRAGRAGPHTRARRTRAARGRRLAGRKRRQHIWLRHVRR